MNSDDIPLWRRLLCPLSWLYAAVMRLRRWAYGRGWLPSVRLGVPVVSVGNIRVGGTGKTPVVSALTAAALERGLRPVILARGYKSGLRPDEAGVILGGRFWPVGAGANGAGDRQVQADEARLLSARHPQVPVVIGANRRAAFAAFRAEYGDSAVDLVILEDGGQHLAIQRDYDIMLVDFRTTAARVRSLPSGNYREGAGVLAAASAIIVTRCPEGWPPPPGRELWRGRPALLAQFRLGTPYRLGPWQGEDAALAGPLPPAHLLTGIAGPERLAVQLRAAGYVLTAASFYGDHEELPVARLTPQNSAGQLGQVGAGQACEGAGHAGNVGWLITEKDLYRQEASFRACPHPVWVVPLQVDVTGADAAGPQSLAELLALALPSS